MARREIFQEITAELEAAYRKHGGAPWGRHEFYGILLEEVEELWGTIKGDDPDVVLVEEAIQVAAMVVRYLETSDETTEAQRTERGARG